MLLKEIQTYTQLFYTGLPILNCVKNRVILIEYAEKKNNSQNGSICTKTVPKIAAVTLKEIKKIYIYLSCHKNN